MPATEYRRADLALEISAGDDGDLRLRIAVSGREEDVSVPGALRAWIEAEGVGDFSGASADLQSLLSAFLPDWGRAIGEAGTYANARVLPRLLLRCRPAEARLPWEVALLPVIGSLGIPHHAAVVRDTRVRPSAEREPFTLPLRVLEVAEPGQAKVPAVFGEILGPHHPRRAVAGAARVAEVAFDDLSGWRPTPEWPTVEVLHFDALPTLADPRVLLSTASAGTPGTLGWTMRFADGAQTRLVVVRCADRREHAAACELGAAMVARGGPALLAVAPWVETMDIYGPLLHDRPLDWIVGVELGRHAEFGDCALFAGAGREEALRVSRVGTALMELAERIAAGDEEARAALWDEVRASAEKLQRREAPPGAPSPPPAHDEMIRRMRHLERVLEHAAGKREALRYDISERGGLLPTSDILDTARLTLGHGVPRMRARGNEGDPDAGPPDGGGESVPPQSTPSGVPPKPDPGDPPPPRPASAVSPRFVTPSLWAEREDGGAPERIPQDGGRLRLGETVQLGVRIGREDVRVRVGGARAILEEVFFERLEDEGTWIEIGVTGLDFEVLGDPVRELWLPRQGDTDLVHFPVRPMRSGVSRLRFCIYRGQDVVQSFRLAALVDSDGERVEDVDRGARLSEALGGVSRDEIGAATWFPRLEYSLVEDAAAPPPDRAERAVAIVANDLDGETVVTVKGADQYFVRTPGDIADRVQAVRTALDEAATVRAEGKPPRYAWGRPGDPAASNAGDEAVLKEALKKLARVGWELYVQVVPGKERKRLRDILDPAGQVIHVAHVLLEKVIPWSLLYDAEYDAGMQTGPEGRPVAHDACLAALPGADGALPAHRCGELPTCPLHPDRVAERTAAGAPELVRETVACPLRFWGFKHVVEIPPQQVRPGGAGHDVRDTVRSRRPVRLLAGLNESLRLAQTHLAALEALVGELGGSADWTVKEFEGDEILRRLDDPGLDLIYLYCHARGGRADLEKREPCLEFLGAGGQPRQITSANLADGEIWEHAPLVVLNGCGTVAFSPDALSPFLPVLVEDRGAAGLLGTEISVWEQLAGEFARDFLHSFLSGESAGKALLVARRKLLAQRNPLGLAYTLYADAGLRLEGAATPGAPGTPAVTVDPPGGG